MVAAHQPPQPIEPKRNRRAQGRTLVQRKPDRREKRFAELIVQGWTLAKAYESVSGAKKKETCEQQGWRWRMRPAIEAEIIRLRANLTEATAATRAEKRNILSRVMRAEETPPSVIVSAVAVDNRMTGDDEPFRKAAGDDLRVQFFVVRLGEEAGALRPGEPADPAREAINVTPTAATVPALAAQQP